MKSNCRIIEYYRDVPVNFSTRSKKWSQITGICFAGKYYAVLSGDFNPRLTQIIIHPSATKYPDIEHMSLRRCVNRGYGWIKMMWYKSMTDHRRYWWF